MNWSEMKNDWGRMKPLVQSHWPLLTVEDLGTIDGSRVRLVGVLQTRYGFTSGEAEDAVCAFEKDVRRPGAVK
jgi:hypothetical protein